MTHEYFALAAQLAFDHARRRIDHQGVTTMPGKYDYPDPGQDPAYCGGLAAGDEDGPYMQWAPIPKRPWSVHKPDGRVIKRFTTAARAHAYLACLNSLALTPEGAGMDMCDWCNELYTNREYYPYCSSQCGLYAERDDRQSNGTTCA